MTIAAVIDVGTNAIRLAWSEVDGAGVERRQGYERYALRLGTDVFEVGKLKAETVEDLVEVFNDMASTMRAVGVDSYQAVATSAMRNAKNGRTVSKRILRDTGIELEIISGERESRLSRAALGRAVGGVSGATLLIDLGGGSLELERADGGFVHSVPFGTVRILNQYPELREPMGPKTLERYRKQIYADLHDALAGCRAGKVAVGTGGNLDALARIIPTDSGLVPAIDVSSLREAMGRVAPLSLEERMKFYGLREDRADLVVPAMLVIESLVKHFRLGAVQVPGSGMREAILYEQLKGEGWACDVHAIAMRFGLTPARFERRALIARGLFTALYPLHRLYPQAQRILELALALADSGQLIGHERGLEHTLYIAEHLEDSELDAEGQALLGYILASQSEEFKRRYGRRLRAAQRRAGDALGILYQIALTLTDLGVRKPPKLGLTTQPIGVHVGQSWEGVAPLFEILGEQLGCVFEQAA